MQLLSEKELEWSAVVANNRMNRKRGASGVNSYEKELGFRPELWLEQCIEKRGSVRWLDVCCGEGNALADAAVYLAGKGLQEKAALTGIDLVDHFVAIPGSLHCLRFETGSVAAGIDGSYDLITCIHGLHYLGNKLQTLENIFGALDTDGLFMGNFALESIKAERPGIGGYVKNKLKQAGIVYNGRRHMIECRGRKQLHFELDYLGADDTAGPNYTGQEAVDSWYRF